MGLWLNGRTAEDTVQKQLSVVFAVRLYYFLYICTLLIQPCTVLLCKVRVPDIINSNLNLFSTLVTTKTAHSQTQFADANNLFVWHLSNNKKKTCASSGRYCRVAFVMLQQQNVFEENCV